VYRIKVGPRMSGFLSNEIL